VLSASSGSCLRLVPRRKKGGNWSCQAQTAEWAEVAGKSKKEI
jgi:hypothetical protein